MGIDKVIGRTGELGFLKDIWESPHAEFVAVYGRRRVGKTHLIREFFSNQGRYFELTGLKDGDLKTQLRNFAHSLAQTFHQGDNVPAPHSWQEAFELLTQRLKKQPPNQKIAIFLDELPWLASRRSHLIQQLDYFWNTEWSKLDHIKLIVCGSAASWMLDNLINAKGGLYNRLTHTLLLQPLTLAQTKTFLEAQGITLNNKQVLDIYMITGGIPHYLKHIKRGQSAIQNINRLCFLPDGLLFNEFLRLFSALFDNPELSLLIIRHIAKARYGISAQALSQYLNKKTGGTFTKALYELESAGFIQRYLPYDRKNRDHYYRIIDEYTLFYLSWIEHYKEHEIIDPNTNYWHLASQTTQWKTWAGYAFESICYKHIHAIRHALNLDTIHCRTGHWRTTPTKNAKSTGTQIDLLIDRDDGVITLCEIKYNQKPLVIDKNMAMNLIKKTEVYQELFSNEKHISIALITVAGIKPNVWSKELVEQVVTLESFLE